VKRTIYVAECTCGAWDASPEMAFRVHERSKRAIRASCKVRVREVQIPAERCGGRPR
jgi:hypothetical protein